MFAAAFLAGAAAAVGLNRTLDVHLAQRQPRVESEPIFVALRSLPQGAPLTVWDVALRDWPKAMLPAAALRARDSFDGMVLKHPIREGQPVLSVQLVRVATPADSQVAEASAAPPMTPMTPMTPPAPAVTPSQQPDLWAPADVPALAVPPAESVSQTTPPAADSPAMAPTAPVDALAAEPAPAADPTDPVAQPADVAPPAAVAAENTVAGPVVAEPVLVEAATVTDIESAIASTTTAAELGGAWSRATMMRYLVVPERIALEADRSFVVPSEPEQPEAEPETVSQHPPQRSPPPLAKAQGQQGRGDRPATRTSSNREGQAQRPPRSALGPSARPKQPPKQSFLRSMLPSLSPGMGAAEPEPQPAGKPEPQPQPSTRSTFRGFGLFR